MWSWWNVYCNHELLACADNDSIDSRVRTLVSDEAELAGHAATGRGRAVSELGRMGPGLAPAMTKTLEHLSLGDAGSDGLHRLGEGHHEQGRARRGEGVHALDVGVALPAVEAVQAAEVEQQAVSGLELEVTQPRD